MRISDWSSDVCSSDLGGDVAADFSVGQGAHLHTGEIQRLPAGGAAHMAQTQRGMKAQLVAGRGAQLRMRTLGTAGFVEIGRASWRERVWQYVWIPVCAVSLKKHQVKNVKSPIY